MRRFHAAILLVFLPVALTGCLRPVPPNARPSVPKTPEPNPIPAVIDGRGWHITWRSRNTEKAGKKAIPVLIADAQTGALSNETDPPTIRLDHVLAHLYKEGKHTADIQAAQIEANQGDEIVHASGGVTLSSITKPPDTVITADAMTWDTKTDFLIAEGHVRVMRRAHGNRPAFLHSGGDHLIYNMKRDSFDEQ